MSNTTEKRYSNNTILNPDGKFMCRCDDKRSQWYLKRNLATVVEEDPLVIKLTFEPKGNGHNGELFYEQTLSNRCVICGNEKKLTAHHVVPREFRKHMPDDVKNHNHHDILTMCNKCHFKYEKDASVLKKELSIEYGVPTEGTGKSINLEMRKMHSTAKTILRHGTKIPSDRFKILEQIIVKHYGEDYTEEDLKECAQKSFIIEEDWISFGEQVVGSIMAQPDGEKLLTDFVKRWRNHFLKTAEPKHLPDYWNVDHEVWRSQ